MKAIIGILDKVKEKLNRWLYRRLVNGVRKTPPVANFSDDSELYVLSMVRSADIDMLLIAIKSFIRFVKVKGVIIVIDSDVTNSDKLVLEKHLVNVEIRRASDFCHPNIPRGGTWERLYAISAFNDKGFIIQIDADTITNKVPNQVIDCVKNNCAFTLGTKSGQKFYTVNEASEFATTLLNGDVPHIQVTCESLLESLPSKYSHYVRGCSGFAGFPKGKLGRAEVEALSKLYWEMVQDRWLEWGTEQFTSNLLISNINPNQVLLLNDYNVPKSDNRDQVFVHYIGPLRFKNMHYLMNTKKVINELM